ncbi:hypothetical protein BO83DRAFT_57369 [Aspergillus eucalypticola CBS 122712]|uniref:Uncharacterized protein n=1 Tax=Aspergillus eucalypticola (strain CBS 122712 / IBT 29274) TaxID=1448314 RepID=A0A317VC17_ASPEC|nr:uncharacterized protein BO83DRAFT_57369 [Aspergillus eucalypticola CBS 122712]PWY70607.1 hypothetical protein BO83DRAFT_57369 [Aspergillus eucalypticola CBS 122712]
MVAIFGRQEHGRAEGVWSVRVWMRGSGKALAVPACPAVINVEERMRKSRWSVCPLWESNSPTSQILQEVSRLVPRVKVSVTLSLFPNTNASCKYNMPLSPGRHSFLDSSRSLRLEDVRWPLLVRSALTRKPTFRQEGGSPIRNPNFCTSHGFRTPIACCD